jgi:hypothetical protein
MATVNRRREAFEADKDQRERLVPVVQPVIVEHEFIIEEIIHTQEEIISTD